MMHLLIPDKGTLNFVKGKLKLKHNITEQYYSV